jgi:hypothetical protein
MAVIVAPSCISFTCNVFGDGYRIIDVINVCGTGRGAKLISFTHNPILVVPLRRITVLLLFSLLVSFPLS